MEITTISKTKSLCPECLKILDAEVYDEDNTIYIEKTCPEHGNFKNTYWRYADAYKKAINYESEEHPINNPSKIADGDCPSNCGLCNKHESQTVLGLIDVTNRCNLRCPICFANAAASGTLFEPSQDEIRQMLKNLRKNRPVPTTAIQYAGGEPTVRDDIVELIKIAKEEGFTHTQIATNGIALANNENLAQELKDAGLNTVYLQFDGITEEPYIKTRNANILGKKIEAIENCRKANLGIVLVPTLVTGINDDQIGDIIQFALDNIDVIRGVNFQPVSFAGRTPSDKVEEQRITIDDFMKAIEKQTNGNIPENSFYPASSVAPISDLIAAMNESEAEVTLTCHEHCGVGTYIFKETDGSIIPITEFINVDKFISLIEESIPGFEKQSRLSKTKTIAKALKELPKTVNTHETPSYLDMTNLLKNIFIKKDYEALGDFHMNALLVSSMHFMDPFNFDQNRVRRCVIHYATPDGRIIPFCTMNNIYREEIEEKCHIPLDSDRAKAIMDNIRKAKLESIQKSKK
ncbi:tetraether lipid synthase Tes [Methanosphaera sp. WGK6]|uniref:tetraether lipid synthase Tes n=1 Tax=Methanosphaera sp. WGK6 TaxID=1561964 RepID=UPI00084C93F0|nr:radical SAM protein [Methanosphaera sp. WGK6]